MLLEEGGGAAQDGVVEVVAEVGDHAEAGVIDQVCAEVIAQAFDDSGDDQRVADDGEGVVEMRGDQSVEVERAVELRNVEAEGVVVGRAGLENLVENLTDEQDAERGEEADDRHQEDRGERIQHVRTEIGEEAKDALHAAPAWVLAITDPFYRGMSRWLALAR